MTVYAIHATVLTHAGEFSGSVQVPLFYLDSDVQGIVSATHAVDIARGVLNPVGLIAAGDLQVSACAVTPDSPAGRHSQAYTHTTVLASGRTAGWHRGQEAAQRCADECNKLGPSDPASVRQLEGDEAWDALFAATE
jgi:hypothetical protein